MTGRVTAWVLVCLVAGLTAQGCSESSKRPPPPTASANQSTVAVSPATGVVADGVDAATITVTVRDGNGNPIGGRTVTLAVGGANNTIIQPAAPTDSNGVATGSLTSTTAETKDVTATVGGSPSTTISQTPTVTFVGGALASVAFRVEPSDAGVGGAITPAVEVELLDAFGNLVPTAQAVTIALANNPAGATLSGTLTRTASNGVAVFDDLSLNTSGSGFTFTASSGAVAATSAPINVVPPRLAFVSPPGTVPAGAVFLAPVRVAIQDPSGNTIGSASDAVTIARASGPGNLSGTTTVNAVGGVATFSDLSLDAVGAHTLAVSASGLTGATSGSFQVDAVPAVDGLGHVDGGAMTFTRGTANDAPKADTLLTLGDAVLDPVNHRLYVADTGNSRVLVFNLSNNDDFVGVDRVADYVLGQPDFRTGSVVFPVTRAGLNNPDGLALDVAGNRLFVSDTGYNRVLVFNTAALADGMDPSNVLGQPDFITSTTSFPPVQDGLTGPQGLAYDATNDLLFVADTGNHRVLVFDVAAITDGENAVNVLGQSLFTTSNSPFPPTAASMFDPRDLALDPADARLFVADASNNRVTVFNVGGGITDGMAASNVLGQALFTTTTVPGIPSASSLNQPIGIEHDSAGRLFVTDRLNNRILVFATGTITDGMNASNVLGQSVFTLGVRNTTQAGLAEPDGLAAPTGTRLFVMDNDNNRVLLFDTTAISDGENALDGLGHLDGGAMTYTRENLNDAPFADSFLAASDVALDAVNHRLFVADSNNNRVLVFNLSNANDFTGVDRVADVVLGQPDFKSTGTSPVTQSSMSIPRGIAWANDRLYVADGGNNRVLIFDTTTLSNGMNASNVLGQTLFTTSTAATSINGLRTCGGLAVDAGGNRLFVADQFNHRVLVFDIAAISNGEAAVNVLGQAVFNTMNPATSQVGMRNPRDVAYDAVNDRLFVSDTTNHRVLVFDVTAISDGENAVNVLGQAGFGTMASATTQTGLNTPGGIAYDSGRNRLWVSDGANHRCLLFDTTAISDGDPARFVLGQSSYTGNSTSATQTGLKLPGGGAVDPATGRLFLPDTNHSRVLLFAP